MDCPNLQPPACGLLPGITITPATCERCRAKWVDGQPPTEEALTPILIRLRPSRGLGDTVRKLTEATGIHAAAKTVERITGVPCGCEERQKRWNEAVPYTEKPPTTAAN